MRAFELTLNDPEVDALHAIEAVAGVAAGLGLDIGAGTVLSTESAQRALDAGATFLVCPHLDATLVAWAAARGVPIFPGCATPTEVLAAWRAGAAAVKLFPASVAGPAFVRELRGPFPDIPLVPTGGVTLESAPAFIAAGAVAVGVGGWLIGNGATDGIRERAAQIVGAVAAARAGRRPVTEVVTLGECLIAFVATTPGPLAEATTFERFVVGAEANVAVGLARLGHPVAYIGRVGADGFGDAIRRRLLGEGVDCTRLDDGSRRGDRPDVPRTARSRTRPRSSTPGPARPGRGCPRPTWTGRPRPARSRARAGCT